MSALLWGVKASFVGYVSAMGDGSVDATGTAEAVADVFRFPGTSIAAGKAEPGGSADDHSLRFTGGVRFTGHGGVLELVIGEPALERRATGWVLTISDPYVPGARVDLATVGEFDDAKAPPGAPRAGSRVALTSDGADLFFGPYTEGTPLDNLTVILP